jgi:hypothetical protein
MGESESEKELRRKVGVYVGEIVTPPRTERHLLSHR